MSARLDSLRAATGRTIGTTRLGESSGGAQICSSILPRAARHRDRNRFRVLGGGAVIAEEPTDQRHLVADRRSKLKTTGQGLVRDDRPRDS